jgi:hypothetical protein
VKARRAADNDSHSVAIARNLIAAKIANTRTLLQRAARDHGEKCSDRATELLRTADFLSVRMDLLRQAETLDTIRGLEGDAAVTTATGATIATVQIPGAAELAVWPVSGVGDASLRSTHPGRGSDPARQVRGAG